MKTRIIALVILVCVAFVSKAQDQKNKFEFDKFKSEKIAFITTAIDLTPSEAEKFWPVYNQFEKKKFEIMEKRRALETKIRNEEEMSKLTDKDCAVITREMANLQKADGELMVEYNEEFLKLLPAKRVIDLFNAEFQFRKQLLKDYRNRECDDQGKSDQGRSRNK